MRILGLSESTLLTFLVIISVQGCLSQLQSNATGHCNTTRIRLLSYFPCTSTQSYDHDECDVYAYAAAVLAVEEVNSQLHQEANELNVSFELLPVETNEDPDAAAFRSAELWLKGVDGVIGPYNPEVADRVVPIATRHLDAIQVSYAVTDRSIDKEGYFYRTLPSDKFLSEARLDLLLRFEWLKVGVLSSNERTYAEGASNFEHTFNEYDWKKHNNSIAVSGNFISSPEHALSEMEDADIKIILGYFNHNDARKTLCLAESYGLVSPEHVWILPFYSQPYWWKLNDEELDLLPPGENCSNQEMITLLDSTIFFDAVKFPPWRSQRNINDRLWSKVNELFPSLSSNKTLHYSQGARAYEAVWLMASAWNYSLTSGQCRPNTKILEYLMFCELCEIYGECIENNTELVTLCPNCLKEEYSESFHEWVRDYYGQVAVWQFHDGSLCPVGLYWPYSNNKHELIKLMSSGECLNDLLVLFGANLESSHCPLNFTWRGSETPPDGGYSFTYSAVPDWGLVFNAVFLFLVICYAAFILLVNITCRKNKYIKASSPHLNSFIIIGLMILPFYSLFGILQYSIGRFSIPQYGADFICQFEQWIYFLSRTVVFAFLLVKNVRIYRIFHNGRLVSKLKCLSRGALVLQASLLILPVILVLTVWSAVDKIAIQSGVVNRTGTLYDFNYVNITYCEVGFMWEQVSVTTYMLVLIIVNVTFTMLNSLIPASFREDNIAINHAMVVTLIIAGVESFALALLPSNPLAFAEIFWLFTLLACGLSAGILTFLFIPKFAKAFVVYRKSLKNLRLQNIKAERLRNLKSEKAQLENELAQKETMQREMRKKKSATAGTSFMIKNVTSATPSHCSSSESVNS